MILVTGASGHLGKLVVENLLKTFPASEIVAMVRDSNKAGDLKAKGVAIRVGDYHDPASLELAFAGIEKLLLISSSDFTDRLAQHKNAVDAAKKAGVKHIFYTGVAMNDINVSPLKPLLSDHFQTEGYIKRSGLAYTFLQNSLYYEVISMFLGNNVFETGIDFPAGEGKVNFASRADLAEAAAIILTSKGQEGKTYRLVGTEAVSFADIARELSVLSGKDVTYTNPDPTEFETALRQFGLPEGIVIMSVLFAAGMKNNDFYMSDDSLKGILNRDPAGLKDYLRNTYSESLSGVN